jgi:tetratricopeptide (TPR) repeat protein
MPRLSPDPQVSTRIQYSSGTGSDLHRALREIDKAIAELTELSHERELGYAHHHRGYILRDLARPNDAARCFETAQQIFATLKDGFFQARSLTALGDLQLAEDDPQAAQASWTFARELLEPYGDEHLREVDTRLNELI